MCSPPQQTDEVYRLDDVHAIAEVIIPSTEWCYQRTLSEQTQSQNREGRRISSTTPKHGSNERDIRRLEILESLIIQFKDPDINRQDTGKRRKLHLFGSSLLTFSTQE